MIRLFRNKQAKLVLLLLDGLLIYDSYGLAKLIFTPSERLLWAGNSSGYGFAWEMVWMILFTVTTYYFYNLYDLAGRRKPSQMLWNLLLAHLFIGAEFIVLSYLMGGMVMSPYALLAGFAIQLGLSFSLRLLVFLIQRQGFGRKRTIAVISGASCGFGDSALSSLLRKGEPWFQIERIVREDELRGALQEEEWSGMEALLLGPGLSVQKKEKWSAAAGERNMEVVIIPDFYELYMADAEPQQLDDLLVYSLLPPRLSLPERCGKRLLDLVASSLLLLLASPVLLALFLVIPLSSRGKALYVQERVGFKEQSFQLFKFRSMVEGAEDDTGPVLAGRGDARITPLGQFIRATRLDELPQLFNVLLGQMSLVGPRPERAFFISRFKEELPHYAYRFRVKPGLTGYAQVMAGYATTPSDKLRYDLMYIKQYSLLLDIKILFQTVRVMLQRQQAAGVETTNQIEVRGGNPSAESLPSVAGAEVAAEAQALEA
ncbi:exopolysaccharide biosynthesis polyprenyl glycosylphosphotransferase [Paenibacillus sanguinis]|uniref:exopolysaccharide biosynthesis polyprenyl glycosylphosphotransferase n=1 Tax=Paenibacillus sanguinis TaxID=225906 RepID=UPI0003715FF8|nr:exopolysaccharide biosynthesis polyprenyl glycosylphosphotransferase [Paenibacillus sanguinis]